MVAELEAEFGDCGPKQRREAAERFKKYVHQLEFSAMILEMDSKPQTPAQRLKYFPAHKLKRN